MARGINPNSKKNLEKGKRFSKENQPPPENKSAGHLRLKTIEDGFDFIGFEIDKDYFDVLYNKETNLVYIKHHPLIGAPFEQVKIIDTTDGRFFKAEFFGYQKIKPYFCMCK